MKNADISWEYKQKDFILPLKYVKETPSNIKIFGMFSGYDYEEIDTKIEEYKEINVPSINKPGPLYYFHDKNGN